MIWAFNMDSILNKDRSFFEEGYSLGMADGRSEGFAAGFRTGVVHGVELWIELGLYYEECEKIKHSNERLGKVCMSVQQLIDSLRDLEDKSPSEEFMAVVDKIRGKTKLFRKSKPKASLEF
jgi:flagellar biosynthesis/type III secretory pathway protein FliH